MNVSIAEGGSVADDEVAADLEAEAEALAAEGD
jgi:hypothetical protein